MSPEERRRVVLALVAVQVFFAVHYVAAKVLLRAIDPAAWAALRILAAAACMLVVYVARGVRPIAWADLARLAVFAVFGVTLNQILFIEGLSRTTPSHSALINTTIPVATTVFAVLLGKERLTRGAVLGIVAASLGVAVLLRVDALEVRSEWFLGDLMTQLNACSFSFFLVISRDTIRRVGSLPSTAAVLCFGSIGAALFGGADVMRMDPAAIPGQVWWLAAYIVLFPTLTAYFLNYWALARVDSSRVALFVYLQPVLAAGLSVALLGEEVTPRLLISSVLVFAGVLLATREPRRAAAVTIAAGPSTPAT